MCIAFTAEGEKGVLSVPKGCPPTHPHHAPYWDLREREQSLQNQRAKSSCYTSPIFGTSPTSLLHGASHPHPSIPAPLVRGWRASLKRAGVLLWRYLISHSTANCHPAPPLPLTPPPSIHPLLLLKPPPSSSLPPPLPSPPLTQHHHHHHHHPSPLCSLVPTSLLSLSLSPVISQGMGVHSLRGCLTVLVLETRRKGSVSPCMGFSLSDHHPKTCEGRQRKWPALQ